MRWLCVVSLCILLFSGCANNADFETISDNINMEADAPGEISVKLPDDAVVSVMEDDTGDKLYFCEKYAVISQIEPGGDLERTIKELTGYSAQMLNVLTTDQDGMRRYDCVWSSVGEDEMQVCRAAILDDGSYHYVLSTMGNATLASAFSQDWQNVFESFTVSGAG